MAISYKEVLAEHVEQVAKVGLLSAQLEAERAAHADTKKTLARVEEQLEVERKSVEALLAQQAKQAEEAKAAA